MFRKMFLLVIVFVVFSGCAAKGNLTLFSLPIIGYTNQEDPQIVSAKAAKINAESYTITQNADKNILLSKGVAKNITPENAHLIPTSENDPRHIIAGKVEGDGNMSIHRQKNNHVDRSKYNYGSSGYISNGYWKVGRH